MADCCEQIRSNEIEMDRQTHTDGTDRHEYTTISQFCSGAHNLALCFASVRAISLSQGRENEYRVYAIRSTNL